MEEALELAMRPKSYEKELHSEEPFIRAMYEDLEKRIEEFEEEAITTNEKTSLKDFIGIGVVMAVITVIVFSI